MTKFVAATKEEQLSSLIPDSCVIISTEAHFPSGNSGSAARA